VGAIFLLHGGYLALNTWLSQAAVTLPFPTPANGCGQTSLSAPQVGGMPCSSSDAVAQ
jgi:hypothetical protein